MANSPIYCKSGDILPIFPLPNTILFPGVSVPLHIFEPRYRQMVADSLDSKGVICLATISEKWSGTNEGDFEFYSLGSVCRLANYNTLEDGRYNIILKCLTRCVFSECEYRKNKLYRTAKIEIKPDDFKNKIDKSIENELRQVASNFFKNQPTSSTDVEIKNHFANLEAMQIINILCMNAPITISEKHAIFQKESITEICDVLLERFSSYRS